MGRPKRLSGADCSRNHQEVVIPFSIFLFLSSLCILYLAEHLSSGSSGRAACMPVCSWRCYQPVDVMISINKRGQLGGGSARMKRVGGEAQAKQHCCCQCCVMVAARAGWCESCRAGKELHSCPLTEEI